VIGTLAVDGWAATVGTARMGLGELRQILFSLYQYRSPPINSQFINFMLSDVAL